MEDYRDHKQYPQKRLPQKIQCEEFNHRNEFVEYILLKQNINSRSRLLCRKCVETKFSQQTNEIALIADILEDPYSVLKYTNYQGNVNQLLCDFIYPYDFGFNQDAIISQIDVIRQNFLYCLSKLERKLIENFEEFKNAQSQLDGLKSKFEQYFDNSNLKQSLIEAEKKFDSFSPKDKQQLRNAVNEYVKKLHFYVSQENQDKYQALFKSVEDAKQNFAQKEKQLRLFKYKLDQGLEMIQREIQNMEQTFSTQKFRSSELSTIYMDELLGRIDPLFKQQNNIEDKIQRIYNSKYDGLDSTKVYQKIIQLGRLDAQTLLFQFQTSSFQKFGVWVDRNSSLIFHQGKQQEFQIKNNVIPLVMNYNMNDTQRLMTFGLDDIIILSSFVGCISKLGEGFNVIPDQRIGDKETYLANQKYFDIVKMEIFKVQK